MAKIKNEMIINMILMLEYLKGVLTSLFIKIGLNRA